MDPEGSLVVSRTDIRIGGSFVIYYFFRLPVGLWVVSGEVIV